MNKTQYLLELRRLLASLPVLERERAIEFYNNYFDEAGEENEAAVIEELGPPARLARQIIEQTPADGYASPRNSVPAAPACGAQGNAYSAPVQKKGMSGWLIALIIVVSLPVTLPLAGAAIGLLGGLAGVLIGVAAGLFGVALALVLFGAALAVSAVMGAAASGVPAALCIAGGGLALIGLGLLCAFALVWLVIAAVRLVRLIAHAVSGRLAKRKERME